jgi:hypothetical protein
MSRFPGILFSLIFLALLPAALAAQTSLTGFADAAWKSPYNQVKTQLKNLATSSRTTERVEILMEEKNKYILVRRNEVLYRYNFYKTPLGVARLDNHEYSEKDYEAAEAVLYHVKVVIPFIDATMIKQRLEAAHGKNSSSTVDEKSMMGADVWELRGGFIFQWYEPYQKKAFTRTIDYLSAEMSQQIMKEYEDYFDAREKLILQKLQLK